MPKIHTHYDNLKVMRDAPPEVIRAAYKTLSQKFHPDRNPEDKNATHVFQLISRAYEVLSDPIKRKEHDAWITAEEAAIKSESQITSKPPRVIRPTHLHRSRRKFNHKFFRRYMRHLLKYLIWLTMGTLILFSYLVF